MHRAADALLQQFGHAIAAIEPRLRGGVEVGAQLGEGFELAERGQVEPQAAGQLLHRRDLCGPADAETEMPTFIAGR